MGTRKLPWLNNIGSRDLYPPNNRSPKQTLVAPQQLPQILQGCKLYWIPGDEVDKRRRDLMIAATELGATIERCATKVESEHGNQQWDATITHIVVDSRHKHVDYPMLIATLSKMFNPPSVPLPHDVLVVNDNWICACREYPTMVPSPLKIEYRLKQHL
jgi:hypothetical protein